MENAKRKHMNDSDKNSPDNKIVCKSNKNNVTKDIMKC